jgi:hypothetical protein
MKPRDDNLDDFPADALTTYGIEAEHPDGFIAHVLDVAPAVVITAAKLQREGLKNPPRTADVFLVTLQQQGLVRTVAVLASSRSRSECPQIRRAHSGRLSRRVSGRRFCPIQ